MTGKQRNGNLGLNLCITNSIGESWYILKITDMSVT